MGDNEVYDLEDVNDFNYGILRSENTALRAERDAYQEKFDLLKYYIVHLDIWYGPKADVSMIALILMHIIDEKLAECMPNHSEDLDKRSKENQNG
jgi:hypothetical protein